jgi:hypothetical protein
MKKSMEPKHDQIGCFTRFNLMNVQLIIYISQIKSLKYHLLNNGLYLIPRGSHFEGCYTRA